MTSPMHSISFPGETAPYRQARNELLEVESSCAGTWKT